MAEDAAAVWQQCFNSWPAEVERRGVLVTSFDEQIPFESFAASPDMLLVERRSPDTLGARMVLIAYQEIKALKIVEVLKAKAFQSLGFTIPTGRK